LRLRDDLLPLAPTRSARASWCRFAANPRNKRVLPVSFVASVMARMIKNSAGNVDFSCMRPVIALILGVVLAGLAGSVLREGVPDHPLALIGMAGDAGRELIGREPLTVVFVPGREGVAALRAAVDGAHVVAEVQGAFAMDSGRIFAADHRSATEIIARSGWADREIRIGPSATPVIHEPEQTPLLTRTRVTCGLWAAVVLGLWIAWRAVGAISLRIRGFFRGLRRATPALPETVLVMRVDTSDDVASIRAALPEHRILAAKPHGLAVSGGWIVTAGESVATELSREVGWRNCVLEAFAPDPFGSTSRRCDFIAARTGLELADFDEKAVWSVEDALAILLSGSDWRGPLADEPRLAR
jgi:hypothetical protein